MQWSAHYCILTVPLEGYCGDMHCDFNIYFACVLEIPNSLFISTSVLLFHIRKTMNYCTWISCVCVCVCVCAPHPQAASYVKSSASVCVGFPADLVPPLPARLRCALRVPRAAFRVPGALGRDCVGRAPLSFLPCDVLLSVYLPLSLSLCLCLFPVVRQGPRLRSRLR